MNAHIFCLSMHQLMGIWIISTLGMLWIMLLWTLVHMSFCERMFSFLLERVLGLGLLGQRVIYVNFIRNCQNVSQSGYAISVPINNARGFQFSTSLPTHAIVRLFNCSHANRWGFISDFCIFHCDFIFYFPNETKYLPSSYVVTSHSYISFFFSSFFLSFFRLFKSFFKHLYWRIIAL